ncbi:hypothetical protein Bca101_075890 [Brassica carinata]
MTMAILALCVSSLSIDNHKLLYTIHLFCMRSNAFFFSSLLFSFLHLFPSLHFFFFDQRPQSIVFFSSTQYSVDDHVQSSIRLWALSGEVLSHDSSPRWFVWYSGVPASQQNLEDTDETCADSRYHFDHGSGSQVTCDSRNHSRSFVVISYS